MDTISVGVLAAVDEILAQHAEEDSYDLKDVVHGLALSLLQSDKNFEDSAWVSKGFLGNACGFKEAVNEVPG